MKTDLMTPKPGKVVRPPPTNHKEYRPIDFRPAHPPVPPDLAARLRQLRVEAKRVHSYIAAAARERYGISHIADHPVEAARAVARLEELYAEVTDLSHELLGLKWGYSPEGYRERLSKERSKWT